MTDDNPSRPTRPASGVQCRCLHRRCEHGPDGCAGRYKYADECRCPEFRPLPPSTTIPLPEYVLVPFTDAFGRPNMRLVEKTPETPTPKEDPVPEPEKITPPERQSVVAAKFYLDLAEKIVEENGFRTDLDLETAIGLAQAHAAVAQIEELQVIRRSLEQ